MRIYWAAWSCAAYPYKAFKVQLSNVSQCQVSLPTVWCLASDRHQAALRHCLLAAGRPQQLLCAVSPMLSEICSSRSNISDELS